MKNGRRSRLQVRKKYENGESSQGKHQPASLKTRLKAMNSSAEKPVPVTIHKIAYGACNVPIEGLGTIEQRRITAVLTRLGWVRGKKEVGTRRQLWEKAIKEKTEAFPIKTAKAKPKAAPPPAARGMRRPEEGRPLRLVKAQVRALKVPSPKCLHLKKSPCPGPASTARASGEGSEGPIL